jgi:nicotinate-nucleotide adenylyltransferase
MNIGILLGSFNPIHFGHITMANIIINSNICQKVIFVLGKQNPWKEDKSADFDLRAKMCQMAIEPFHEHCELCLLEKEIEYPTYSYKVLGELRKQYPHDNLFIIGGTDTMETIHLWKNFSDDIKPYFKYIEIARGNTKDKEDTQSLFTISSKEYEELGEIPIIFPKNNDISSTIIRDMVKKDMNLYPYLHENVIKIIKENNLYKNGL